MTENLILLQDALQWSKEHNCPSVIVRLGFAKAYNRIRWTQLHEVMALLGFDPRWRHFIRVLYSAITTCINVKGLLSTAFNVTRRDLQGDPISPYLCVMQSMSIVCMMERLRNTHGILLTLTVKAVPATFYADDTTIIARSPDFTKGLYNVAAIFCKGSKAKLHPERFAAISTLPTIQILPNCITVLQIN